jgi:ABC-type polysaccharide/polyol phosphate transport system ATPase subunit
MDDAIVADRLSKRYVLGRSIHPDDTLRDALTRWRPGTKRAGHDRRELLALDGVSFSVGRGEVLGVIGRNGAGKSTLLKILARITEPSSGSASFLGRITALLEVGTGFHTELTGRDNIYLNGAILGMSRAETARRFDDIVAFAGVERFVDTPVKRYSSGMFVRLAFAVAAHLETEILLVDEVLAVGDMEFQRRCLGQMQEAARGGRTVVFVSHNMQAVRTLCDRAIQLDKGRLVAEGSVDTVVRDYLASGAVAEADIPEEHERTVGTREALVRRVELLGADGGPTSELFFGEAFGVRLLVRADSEVTDLAVEIGVSTLDGLRVATFTSLDGGQRATRLVPGWWSIAVTVDQTFQPGEYALDVALHHWEQSRITIDWLEQVVRFRALDVPETGRDQYVHFATNYNLAAVRGFVRPEATFSPPEPVAPDVIDPGA